MGAQERRGAWRHGPPAAAGAVTGAGVWGAGHAGGWRSGTPRPCARPSRCGSPEPQCLAAAFVPCAANCRAPAGADAAAPPGLALGAGGGGGGGAAALGGMRWGTAAGRSASGCSAAKRVGCSEPAEGKRQRRPGRGWAVVVAAAPVHAPCPPRTRLGRQRLLCAPGAAARTHPALSLFRVKAPVLCV